jgi:hypothetical protein
LFHAQILIVPYFWILFELLCWISYFSILPSLRSLDSLAHLVTTLQVDFNWDLIPDFCFSAASNSVYGACLFFNPVDMVALSVGVKQFRHESEHSLHLVPT